MSVAELEIGTPPEALARIEAVAALESEDLFYSHLNLAGFLATKFRHKGELPEDLDQVAAIGLLKASRRFDPTFGTGFATYATHTVSGELKRHLRDRGWAVRPSRREQEDSITLNEVIDPVTQSLGRQPSAAELAQETGLTEQEVKDALRAGEAYRFAPLDGYVSEYSIAIADTLTDNTNVEETATNNAELHRLLNYLEPRERQIVELRYFQDLSQAEIASRVGLSQMQVSRLLARSLSRMRSHAGPRLVA